ncbi:MAG: DDE-type integrase/transposase/recombinase [Acidobacteriota bacterium]
MSDPKQDRRRGEWARFRFSVVGPLLAAPPKPGELRAELLQLSQKTWRHPLTGEPVHFSLSTIERWLYTARHEQRDPVGALGQRIRKDAGRQRSLSDRLRVALRGQYKAHPSWSYQLHADNLEVLVAGEESLGRMPSYSTVRRYMKSQNLIKRRRKRGPNSPGARQAAYRLEHLEVRSYEAEYVCGLWHLDYHHGSRKVLCRTGWETPLLLGILDDRSRLACHLQWYLEETAETLVHGLSQAIQKRGLPRALLTDNGGAMISAETRQGLFDLGIVHETTLPYSPFQNAKQEVFWVVVEGRLLAMLEGVDELTLEQLNQATQAWVEQEYNRKVHSELGCAPVQRWLEGPDVSRPSPASGELRRAFRAETSRTQRRSDGTISLEGRRFEVPSRYRHLERLRLRYARWDLRSVDLLDPHTGAILSPLYPLDKTANAEGRRRRVEPLATEDSVADTVTPQSGMAPLLRKLLEDYAATGLPPAYLPRSTDDDRNQEESES